MARSLPTAELRYDKTLRDRIMGSFTGPIEPVAVSPPYYLGLVLVAVAMVLLPLIYLALIGLAGYGVYYHAVHNLVLFQAISVRAALVAYLGPLFAGVALVFFSIKPLFARPGRQQAPRSLDREQEPILFDFVDRIAALVGAPRPRRIDVDCQVNASAGFRRGWLSLFGRDLVLTLGLPLTAGLALQQLAGVLAHELGHFAQGGAMRLTFVIRAVNFWFVRVVYERDSWDEMLARTARDSGHWVVLVVLNLTRLMIWLTRRVLWLLMWIGHAVSCFMLRQMEYDADRYEARLVGAETFEATCHELTNLGLSYQKSLADLSSSWQEGRLVDSLPALVGANRRQMDEALLRRVRRQIYATRTRFFDTHPADQDRIRNARREDSPSVFACDLPATALFRDFSALATAVSLDFYRLNLGDRIASENLQAVEQMVARQHDEGQDQEASERFFQGTVNVFRPLRLPPTPAAGEVDFGALLRVLEEKRELLSQGQAAYRKNLERWDEADTKLINALRAGVLLAAGLRIKAADFGLSRGDEEAVEAVRRSVGRRLSQLAEQMLPLEKAAVSRLGHALRLLNLERLVAGQEDLQRLVAERPQLWAAAMALGDGFERLLELRGACVALGILGSQLQDHGDQERLVAEFVARGEEIHGQLVALRELWEPVAYPFEHADATITLGAFAIPAMPSAEDYETLFDLAQATLNRAFGLYMRVMGRLAFIGERLERELGLEPLARPMAPEGSSIPGAE